MHNWMERDFLEASKLKPYKGLIKAPFLFGSVDWQAIHHKNCGSCLL